jgi:hypothetical protein
LALNNEVSYLDAKYLEATKKLEEARKLFSRNSYFDYLDSIRESHRAQRLALEASDLALNNFIRSLNMQKSDVEKDLRHAKDKDKNRKEKIWNGVKQASYGISFLIFTVPIFWFLTKNFFGSLIISWCIIAPPIVVLLIYSILPFSKKKLRNYTNQIESIKAEIGDKEIKLSTVKEYMKKFI